MPKSVYIFILILLFTSSCKATRQQTLTKGLQETIASKQGKNIALFIGDSGTIDTYLQGIAKDRKRHSDLFSELKFKVEVLYNSDKESVLSTVASVAKEVGIDGTLLVFYSGHGNVSGDWIIQGQKLLFHEMAKSISVGRDYQPLQRFVLMSDSCYSGQISKVASLDAFKKGYHYQTLAKQMIFFGSSHPYRISEDNQEVGGSLSFALSKTVRQAKSQNWTVRRWFNETVNIINSYEEGQSPNFAAHPVTLLDEPLFADEKSVKAEDVSTTGVCPKIYGKSWHSKFTLDQNNCPNTTELCACLEKTIKGTFWDSKECTIYPPNSNNQSEAVVTAGMEKGEFCDRIKCQDLFMSDFQKAKSNCRNAFIYVNSEGFLDVSVAVPGTSL